MLGSSGVLGVVLGSSGVLGVVLGSSGVLTALCSGSSGGGRGMLRSVFRGIRRFKFILVLVLVLVFVFLATRICVFNRVFVAGEVFVH